MRGRASGRTRENPQVAKVARAGDGMRARRVPVHRFASGVRAPSRAGRFRQGLPPSSSTARKASWGTSMRPTRFIRFLPSFCFSSSLRLRVMSPP